jgi:hypothetical protein
MAQAEHQALVQSALSSRRRTTEPRMTPAHSLRAHLASGLRSLAVRLDSTTQPG